MGELVDLIDKIKRYYKFTRYELKGLVISIFIIAFVVSFREWGTSAFDFKIGLYNLLNAIFIVALSILIHDAGQRLWALAIGYRIEFKMWSFGLVAALVLAFISDGRLWLIVPGSFIIHHLAGSRLGFFRYGINYFGQAMVALAGPLFSLMLIIFLKILIYFQANPLIEKAIIFNSIYAIISLLPIPPLDGGKIYFGSRMLYAFTMPAISISVIFMIIRIPILFALSLSFLVSTILWLFYYIIFERKIWTGPK